MSRRKKIVITLILILILLPVALFGYLYYKITSIPSKFFNTDSVRVDILHESIPEINAITSVVKDGKRIEGKDYTSGNLSKEI